MPANYSAFNKTFDKLFPKFIWNSQGSQRTWQFHKIVVSQIVNLETKLWISHWISMEVVKFIASKVLSQWLDVVGLVI